MRYKFNLNHTHQIRRIFLCFLVFTQIPSSVGPFPLDSIFALFFTVAVNFFFPCDSCSAASLVGDHGLPLLYLAWLDLDVQFRTRVR